MRTSTAAPTPERRRAAARAFTLLELALTLAVLGLAATLAMPRLGARGGAELRLAADAAARRLAAARWQAVVEGRAVRVPADRLAPSLRMIEPGDGSIVFSPVPAALPRTVVLADAAGATARITIPGGLGALAIALEEAP